MKLCIYGLYIYYINICLLEIMNLGFIYPLYEHMLNEIFDLGFIYLLYEHRLAWNREFRIYISIIWTYSCLKYWNYGLYIYCISICYLEIVEIGFIYLLYYQIDAWNNAFRFIYLLYEHMLAWNHESKVYISILWNICLLETVNLWF